MKPSLFKSLVRSGRELAMKYVPRVHADAAPLHAIGSTMVPDPAVLPDIRMAAEQVDITLYPHLATIEATFDFDNEGPPTEFEVGFPRHGSPGMFKSMDAELNDFGAYVEGHGDCAVSDHRCEHETYPLWKSWRQHFPRGKSRVVVRYWVWLCGYRGLSRCPLTYVLRTGRFWKGVIGEAVVRVHGSAQVPLTAVREVTPDGWELSPDQQTLTWRLRDFEPTRDIGLLISPMAIDMSYFLDRSVDDILELNEDRPPPGTRVAVAGMLFDDGLAGERHWDHHITVPDGLQIVDKDSPSAMVRLSVPLGLPCEIIEFPRALYGIPVRLYIGRIGTYELGEPPIVVAEHAFLLEPKRVDFTPPQPWMQPHEFRWPPDDYPHFWAEEPSRYAEFQSDGHRAGIRGRVWSARR